MPNNIKIPTKLKSRQKSRLVISFLGLLPKAGWNATISHVIVIMAKTIYKIYIIFFFIRRRWDCGINWEINHT